MDAIFGSEYVQTAATVSGLLTLLVLLFQGYKNFIIPFFSLIKFGIKRYSWIYRRSIVITSSEINLSYSLAISHLMAMTVAFFVSLVLIVLSATLTILSVLLFVPGLADAGGMYVDVGIGRENSNIAAIFISIISILNFHTTMKRHIIIIKFSRRLALRRVK